MSSAQNPATARIGKGSGSPSSFSDLRKQPLRHRTALIARLVRLMLVASALLLLPVPGRGVTVFGSGAAEKRIPIPFDFGELWFYGTDGSKVLPDLGLEWVAVVFRPDQQAAAYLEQGLTPLELLYLQARSLLERYDRLTGPLCDTNLLADGCFFGLKRGTQEADLLPFLMILNQDERVDYAHPTLILNEKTYAFFDAVNVTWKTQTDSLEKESLLAQAKLREDHTEKVYRVDLFQMPLFKAINLLAEDIHVLNAAPRLVEVHPALVARMSLGMQGATIGDAIPFAFSVTRSERVQIDPSSFANLSLKPDEIQNELFEIQIDPYDYVKLARENEIRITGSVRFYAPGEFTLPGIRIRYSCPDCSSPQDRTLTTEAVTLKIASLVPAGLKSYTLVVPEASVEVPDKEPSHRTASRRAAFEAALAFALALALAGWLFRRSRISARQRQASLARRREEVLFDRLKEMLAQSPTGPHWVYVEQVGNTFREYLVEKSGIRETATGGSGEVFFRSIRGKFPDQAASRVRELLKEVEKVIELELNPYPGLADFVRNMQELLAGPTLSERHA